MLVAFFGYLAAAWWLRYELNFFIGDALARTAGAVSVAVSRDPHFGDLGFSWPPLSSLIQVPLVFILEPFKGMSWAGPISTSACMAGTVAVLGHIGRSLGLSRVVTVLICLLFAANPVVVYAAANGMSEAPLFLTLSIAMLGYFNWARYGRTRDLAVLAGGLALAVLVRNEAVLITAGLSILAGFDRHSLKRSLITTFTIALPPMTAYALWMAFQWVLIGDPFHFLRIGGAAPEDPFWLPDPDGQPHVAFTWAFGWIILMSPTLLLQVFVIAISGVVRRLRTFVRGSLGVLAGPTALALLNAYLLLNHNTFGDVRYFQGAVLFGTLGVLWLASRPSLGGAPPLVWNGLLLVTLAASAVVATFALTDPVATHVEQEDRFFNSILGRPAETSVNELAAYEQVATDLDPLLVEGGRVLADSSLSFGAIVASEHPEAFIIPNDRDFEAIAADPVGRVDFLVVRTTTDRRRPDGGSDIADSVRLGNPDAWRLAREYPGDISVYQRSESTGSPRTAPAEIRPPGEPSTKSPPPGAGARGF